MKRFIDRFINWGADLPATPFQMTAIFAVTVILRNLMEAHSLGILFSPPAFLLHFPIAYVLPMLTLVFFMRLFSGYNTAKLLKVMVFAWSLTLLPPIVDALTGTTSAIGYFPLGKSNAVWYFANFFNPTITLPGTTTGIRIEAAVGCILAGIFTWVVAPDRRILRGVLNTIVFAPVFLIFFTLPYLVSLIVQPAFLGNGDTNFMLTWHAATAIPTVGVSHFTTFLIDMIPLSILSLWYVRELAKNKWDIFKNKFTSLIPLYSSAILGTITAVAIVSNGLVSFADTVTIAGAMMAAFWLITAYVWQGSFKTVASIIALAIAWASGWETTIFTGLAIALCNLPVSDKLRGSLFSIALFVTALSPVGFSFTAPATVLSLIIIPATIFLSQKKTAASFLLMIPLALVLWAPPASQESALLRALKQEADSFARSGRVDLAERSASRLAGSGGGWLVIGEVAQFSGQNARARYISETAVARGDSSISFMKLLLKDAYFRTDTTEFENIFNFYKDRANDSELMSAIKIQISLYSATGDTASLNRIHSRTGINPVLFRSMSTAQMALGDTLSAFHYSCALLETPSASAADWAKAITLAAASGSGNWDSLYVQAEKRFGYCLPIMLARLRVSILSSGLADRRDLLDKCLMARADDVETLETAALWFSAAGKPDTTLLFASRAIVRQAVPSNASFSLAINAALESGNYTEAAITARYGIYCHPKVVGYSAILAGILRGTSDYQEARQFEESFSNIPWAKSVADSLEHVIQAEKLI